MRVALAGKHPMLCVRSSTMSLLRLGTIDITPAVSATLATIHADPATYLARHQRLCAKASGAILSQAPEHDADHGEVDPGFFTARKHFVVFGEPAPGGKPGKRALHDPAPFEDMEASWADLLPIDHGILGCPDPSHATPGMLHDLHFPAEYLFDPLDEAALLVGDSPPRSTGVAGGNP